MQTTKVILIMMICAMALSACGLKGPLYLPADEPQAGQSVNTDEDGSAETEEKKEVKTDRQSITVSN